MNLSFNGGGDPFGLFLPVLAALVLVAAWVILAGSRFVQGGIVERPERVPQLYGYTVCLIGLVWALTSVMGIVRSGLALSAPAYQRQNDFAEPSVTSFETFRLSYDRTRRFLNPQTGAVQLDSVPAAELRRRYDAYRSDHIERVEVQAKQSLITQMVSLLIAVGIFVFHWRWLRLVRS